MSKATMWDALADLEKIGYRFVRRQYHYQDGSVRPSSYFLMLTPHGERKVKVHARSHQDGNRYMHGVAWALFDVVDEFVFWHEGESWLYIVPASYLKEKWIESGRDAKGTQWVINFWSEFGCFETPPFEIRQFVHDVPNDQQVLIPALSY